MTNDSTDDMPAWLQARLQARILEECEDLLAFAAARHAAGETDRSAILAAWEEASAWDGDEHKAADVDERTVADVDHTLSEAASAQVSDLARSLLTFAAQHAGDETSPRAIFAAWAETVAGLDESEQARGRRLHDGPRRGVG
ncbi:hypothetical protein [Amaricoccus sp.]|uniref:hypothetical protein n=1 Tax=Amaricoccus sp. TaxID=1872485 RepID=UPI001B4FC7D3|nr:hypothetical protein [Amaricoccus sp.]MBP7002285.1 hypothetical protein [Amaricoccus sp.]